MIGLSALLKIGGIIADFLAKAVPFLLAWWGGRKAQQAKDLRRANEVKDAQLEDAARPPRTRDELLERMRRRGL